MDNAQQLDLIKESIEHSGKKLLICLPESAGDIFLSTSLLPSFKEHYPDYFIYYACKGEFHSVLKDNPYVDKVIEYCPIMEQPYMIEGHGRWEGLFDLFFFPSLMTQRFFNYVHNGLDVVGIPLRK
tara:strand:- start:78 stop:455 length:378 start_codon:yes stop_codon:yes gene_type:complete